MGKFRPAIDYEGTPRSHRNFGFLDLLLNQLRSYFSAVAETGKEIR